jgi:hypothetical protein
VFVASALADGNPAEMKTSAPAGVQAASDPKVPATALSATEAQQLQTRTEQFLAERNRYRELQRSGAPAAAVETQRAKMDQARDGMRALRQKDCPVDAGLGRGAGNGPSQGGGRHGMGQGRGSDRYSLGRGHRMSQGAGPGAGLGRGRHGRGHGPGAPGLGRGGPDVGGLGGGRGGGGRGAGCPCWGAAGPSDAPPTPADEAQPVR